MLVHLRRSLVMALVCLALFGFAYAYAGLGVSQLLFRHQADGSLTSEGSTLIGQDWTGTRWFHGRPDDAGPYAADPAAHVSGGDNPLANDGVAGESGATNLGPRSAALRADTLALARWWRSVGVDPTPDLVTTSGSGLDPDISPADALVQVPMVARATGVSPAALRRLIARQTHPAQWGFLGASYVVVLQLNEGLATLERG